MEKEKILIEICAGTTCHVYGSSQMFLLEEIIPEKLKNVIEIEGRTCLGFCKNQKEFGKPPYVKIGDRIISEATSAKIIEYLSTLHNL